MSEIPIIFKSKQGNVYYKDIVELLKKINIFSGDTIFVHSRLFSFGKLVDLKTGEELANIFIKALLEIIGPEGTLILPTFTFSFCKTGFFDSINTESEVGLLSKVFRKNKDVVRSKHPIYSVAVWGRDREYYLNASTTTCFGEDGIFGRIHRKGDVKIVFLGIPVYSLSQLHYLEELTQVPYRYMKTFEGTVDQQPASVDFYVRDLDHNVQLDMKGKFVPLCEEANIVSEYNLGDSSVSLLNEGEAHELILKKMKEDPCYFLKHPYLKKDPLESKEENVERNKDNGESKGKEMYDLMRRLFPICRSITGDGVRETLKIIKEHLPLEIHEVPSGTKVFDWTVPKEWNVRDAYVKNSQGEKIIDFKRFNLHLVSYSTPVNQKMSLAELKKHLFTLPDQPSWIPYRTSYYRESWGFCLTQEQYDALQEDTYEVVIDSTLADGHLTYGELFLPGESKEEILLTCYTCHPSMCNDNLSGVVLLTFLAQELIKQKSLNKNLHYSYRFLFIPETIGSITWLALNEKNVQNIKHGLIATCVGGSKEFVYKKTRSEQAIIDKVVEKVLADSGEIYDIVDFCPLGSDERQFCSPGFNLPVGSLTRAQYDQYPEYHTSADNLDFVRPEILGSTFKIYQDIFFTLENNFTYFNLNPKCEPQLGKRNLYGSFIGGQRNTKETMYHQQALMWTLNLSDGTNSLLDIALRSKMDFRRIKHSADVLIENDLLALSNDKRSV